MSQATMELQNIGVTCTVADYSVEHDKIRGHLVHTLQAMFVTERQTPYVYYTPKNWFEHLKQSVFPKWMLKRWPVKEERHEVGLKLVYPFLKSKLPLNLMGHSVVLMINDTCVARFLPDAGEIDMMEWRKEVQAILLSQKFGDSNKCPVCHRAYFES